MEHQNRPRAKTVAEDIVNLLPYRSTLEMSLSVRGKFFLLRTPFTAPNGQGNPALTKIRSMKHLIRRSNLLDDAPTVI